MKTDDNNNEVGKFSKHRMMLYFLPKIHQFFVAWNVSTRNKRF